MCSTLKFYIHNESPQVKGLVLQQADLLNMIGKRNEAERALQTGQRTWAIPDRGFLNTTAEKSKSWVAKTPVLSTMSIFLCHILSPRSRITNTNRHYNETMLQQLQQSTLICLYPSTPTLICLYPSYYAILVTGPNVPAEPFSTLRMYNAHFISFLLLSHS
jgi:hypothetical protein